MFASNDNSTHTFFLRLFRFQKARVATIFFFKKLVQFRKMLMCIGFFFLSKIKSYFNFQNPQKKLDKILSVKEFLTTGFWLWNYQKSWNDFVSFLQWKSLNNNFHERLIQQSQLPVRNSKKKEVQESWNNKVFNKKKTFFFFDTKATTLYS